uniref:Vitellogenin n=1 Tax=Romanomermis culicivorax TaxID=13658 RepID=A0A915KL73_ROMCU
MIAAQEDQLLVLKQGQCSPQNLLYAEVRKLGNATKMATSEEDGVGIRGIEIDNWHPPAASVIKKIKYSSFEPAPAVKYPRVTQCDVV